jgi:hypothetical protein
MGEIGESFEVAKSTHQMSRNRLMINLFNE